MDAKILEQWIKQLYSSEEFYLFLLASTAGFIAFTNIFLAVSVLACLAGIPFLIFKLISNHDSEDSDIITVPEKEESIVTNYSGISLGKDDNNNAIVVSVEDLGHTFIIGMTGYGKTRLVYGMITEILTNYRPEDVKLCFSDAKEISFDIFSDSAHLFAPIARTQEETTGLVSLLLIEMRRRLKLFGEQKGRLCDNIDKYKEITGHKLPRIIVFFDEVADSVERGSDTEKDLTTLAKVARATGIQLVLITQRPTNEGITHEVTSQCQTYLSTYMKNNTEYGTVAKIPKDIYRVMNTKATQGLFMMFSPKFVKTFTNIEQEYNGWGFVMANYITDETIERIALANAIEGLVLPELETKISWGGSEQDKLDSLEELEIKEGELTAKLIMGEFGVSRPTATSWMKKYESN